MADLHNNCPDCRCAFCLLVAPDRNYLGWLSDGCRRNLSSGTSMVLGTLLRKLRQSVGSCLAASGGRHHVAATKSNAESAVAANHRARIRSAHSESKPGQARGGNHRTGWAGTATSQ